MLMGTSKCVALILAGGIAAGCGGDRFLVGTTSGLSDGGAAPEGGGAPEAAGDSEAQALADGGMSGDTGAPAFDGPGRSSGVACSFGAAPMPVRELLIPPDEATRRLQAFLRDSAGLVFSPGQPPTTADLGRAVSDYYGARVPDQLSAQAFMHVLPFVADWLETEVNGLAGRRYLTTFASGRGGLGKLLTEPFGPPTEGRVGIFSEASVLSSKPRASTRGVRIRNALLCQEIPPAPAGVDVMIPPSDPRLTYRQRLEKALSDPAACQDCHRLIDPPGFAFEHFDEAGQYRLTDNGRPIDATGSLTGLDGGEIHFDGPPRLMAAIAGSCAVRECLARKWLVFALRSFGRALESEDETSVREVAAAFNGSGGDLVELVIAVVQSPAFSAP